MTYIDPAYRPMAEHCFMARFELLGAQVITQRDVSHAALWICTLQAAAIDMASQVPGVEILPNPEGVYAICATREALERWMRLVMEVVTDRLQAAKLLKEVEPFLVSGAFGQGKIVRGDTFPEAAAPTLSSYASFRRSIFVGALFDELRALVATAPPVGIAAHASVKAGEQAWWPWWAAGTPISPDVYKKINAHLDAMASGPEPVLDAQALQEGKKRLRAYTGREA